ncbi:hypothetical protein ACFLR2_02095 [Chlamydiota bacterium]
MKKKFCGLRFDLPRRDMKEEWLKKEKGKSSYSSAKRLSFSFLSHSSFMCACAQAEPLPSPSVNLCVSLCASVLKTASKVFLNAACQQTRILLKFNRGYDEQCEVR